MMKSIKWLIKLYLTICILEALTFPFTSDNKMLGNLVVLYLGYWGLKKMWKKTPVTSEQPQVMKDRYACYKVEWAK